MSRKLEEREQQDRALQEQRRPVLRHHALGHDGAAVVVGDDRDERRDQAAERQHQLGQPALRGRHERLDEHADAWRRPGR